MAAMVDDRGIPARLNLCGEVLDESVRLGLGGRTAFVWDGGAIGYAELLDRVKRLAGGLAGHGIERAMPVLVRMSNCLEFAITFLALTRIGAIPVLHNSLLADEEVDYVLQHSQARAAVSLATIADPLLAHAETLKVFVWRAERQGATRLEPLIDGPATMAEPADTALNEPAFMVYTSGTTGRPKGIVHAHRWVRALGEANRWRVPPELGDVAWRPANGVSSARSATTWSSRSGTASPVRSWRAAPSRRGSWRRSRRSRSRCYSVATVYRRILAIEGVEHRFDLSSLRGCSATGEALEAATWEEFKRRIGCDIWEHYGVSEMQMVLGQGPRHPVRPGSIGVPVPGTAVAVRDEAYGELPAGVIGRFLIAADNPGFFLGYHRDQAMTDRVVHDGWYHTGDLAWHDQDGYYWIAGREDDCFKSRGIFISPYEIEDALRRHPAVAEACVVASPDPEIGNKIRAVVVTRGADPPDPGLGEQIRVSLRDRIAPYKVPQIVEIVDSLPKSPVGKVLRRKVAQS